MGGNHSPFKVHRSKFTIHNSKFTVHNSQFTILLTRAVFIASTFDKKNPLYEAFTEADGVNDVVTTTLDWKCLHIHKANFETVTERFSSTEDFNFQVFHFAGHAIDKALQFNTNMPTEEELEIGSNFMVGVGGLADIIKEMHPIQLVFLNGCSTIAQVNAFIEAGVPAVIYTTQPLSDRLGSLFAQRFYFTLFKKNTTLGQAFNIAKAYLNGKKGEYENEGFDAQLAENMNRGGALNLSTKLGKDLYELAASEEFKQKRISDWPKPPMAVKQQDANFEIPKKNVLYLNRDFQVGIFKTCLSALLKERNKSVQERTSPHFFFIHEHDHACPLDFVERLTLYGAAEFCESYPGFDTSNFAYHGMGLPEINLVANSASFSDRLFEIYSHYFQHNENKFQPTTQMDRVFIIHHKLNDWGTQSAGDLELLLKLYLNEFGAKLREELGALIVVVFSFEYVDPNAEFIKIFKNFEKEQEYNGRINNLTELKKIEVQEVVNWRRRVFKDWTIPEPPPVKTLFPFDEPQTMQEAKTQLLRKLIEFNKRINSTSA